MWAGCARRRLCLDRYCNAARKFAPNRAIGLALNRSRRRKSGRRRSRRDIRTRRCRSRHPQAGDDGVEVIPGERSNRDTAGIDRRRRRLQVKINRSRIDETRISAERAAVETHAAAAAEPQVAADRADAGIDADAAAGVGFARCGHDDVVAQVERIGREIPVVADGGVPGEGAGRIGIGDRVVPDARAVQRVRVEAQAR
jgi:hypothetical protein